VADLEFYEGGMEAEKGREEGWGFGDSDRGSGGELPN